MSAGRSGVADGRGGTSVCTIVRGRRAHLGLQVRGLARQDVPPAELVIGYAQDAPFAPLPEAPFPIRTVMLDEAAMPFARARNAAASAASGSLLVFADVDCTPGPGLVRALEAATVPGRCVMGEVRYAAGDDPDPGEDFERAWNLAATHAARRFGDGGNGRDRPGADGLRTFDDPGEFWSTLFAIRRADFDAAGRFDERYAGYGGEDTDFGRALAAAGIAIDWCPAARSVHRWHAVQVPPLDALESIVSNLERFVDKHGEPCMDYWLDQFEAGGWIRRRGASVEIARLPSAEERELARQPPSVRFS